VVEIERARVLRVKLGMGALLKVEWGDLDHVEPANRVLVTTIDALESAAIRTDNSLGRNVAHAQQHVQNVGEAVGLAEVIGRTLVQRPL